MKLFKKFGPHYAIERFGVLFLSLVLMMVALMSSIVMNKMRYDAKTLSGMAQYTSSFAMSLSGTSGSVRGVYTNKDHSKSFILLQFDSTSSIPITADKYQLFLSGCNKNQDYQEIKSKPNAQIYMFGSTGYMGIYLYASEPFPSQILNLYLRSTVNFAHNGTNSDEEGDDVGSTYEDKTFADYDQAQIYFNPGGSYATQVAFLDEPDWDIFDVYEELVSRPAEKAIRTLLRSDLTKMRDQQLLMKEYTTRLVGDDSEKDVDANLLTSPTVPAVIADDVVYGKTIDGSSKERLQWSIKQNQWFAPEELVGFEDSNVEVYLDTKFVEPNGYQFDWQNGQVKTGYLKELTGSNSLSDWKKYLDGDVSEEEDDGDSGLALDDIVWTYKDGTIFVPDGDSEEEMTSKEQTLSENITLLTDAWTAFYEAKVDYQTVQLKALLQLEYDSRDIETSYSINSNESGDLLTLW